MHPETLAALRASIAKYERLLTVTEPPPSSAINSSSCALCQRFAHCENDEADECELHGELCPVHERTSLDDCKGTPWHLLQVARDHWCALPSRNDLREAFVAAVQVELDFLRSLLPEETRP